MAYNDSRGRFASPINISGASISTDGGTTFTRITTAGGQSPFAATVGDPVALYNKPTGTWFTVWLDTACGAQGLGGYKSATPANAASWTHFCIHTSSSDDRESGWADNNTASPFYGRMYISWATAVPSPLPIPLITASRGTLRYRLPRPAPSSETCRSQATFRATGCCIWPAWTKAVAASRTTTSTISSSQLTEGTRGLILTPVPLLPALALRL